MADTRQIVSWSIEKNCAFRKEGKDWFLPSNTSQQLSDLRTLASAVDDNRVVDGICVTSWTTQSDNSDGYHDIPCDGFLIEERLGKFGGIERVNSTCGSCEANADSKLKTKVAGCFGYVDAWPDSPDLDEQLWKIIESRKLEQRLRSLFPVTTPLWYGFWVNSPLQRIHCEFLHELFGEACDPDDPQDDDFVHFLSAIKQAAKWELPVHVSLAPLGHTDFGWYTVFPHCPRCKANAPVGRWKDKYPDGLVECKVCGNSFNPDQSRSQEKMDYDWEASSLEKLLERNGHESFIKRFLMHRGCSPELADEIVDNKNYGPLLREIDKVRRKRKATLRQIRSANTSKKPDKLPQHISVEVGDSAKMDFVLIPAGQFQMGSPDSVDRPTESPQHLVQIEKPFTSVDFPSLNRNGSH